MSVVRLVGRWVIASLDLSIVGGCHAAQATSKYSTVVTVEYAVTQKVRDAGRWRGHIGKSMAHHF